MVHIVKNGLRHPLQQHHTLIPLSFALMDNPIKHHDNKDADINQGTIDNGSGMVINGSAGNAYFTLADPTAAEEEVCSSSLTVVYDEEGTLQSMYKPGGTAMDKETLSMCQSVAQVWMSYGSVAVCTVCTSSAYVVCAYVLERALNVNVMLFCV